MIDLDAEMQFWVDALALRDAGWKITWGWVDSIPLEDGRNAFGLNTLNADDRVSNIKIRELRSEIDRLEFVDTCAHEIAHCWGAEIERRFLEAHAQQNEDARTRAHEYIATTMAPLMEKIKGTPREIAFAKAVKALSQKTEAFAKVAQSMPARAKGQTNMPEDIASLEKAMIEARLAGDTAKVAELFDKWLAAKVTAQSGDNGPPSVPAVDPLAAAEPPKPPVDPNAPPAAKPLEEPGMYKAFSVLAEARQDFTPERRKDVLEYLKKHHKTVEGAAEYLKTIPLAKAQQEPKAPAAKPIDDKAPRAGEGQTMRLGKTDKDSQLSVAKAMGQPIEPTRGPSILTKPDGQKTFTLGNMTPTEYREKRATGWDPRKEFPQASEVAR